MELLKNIASQEGKSEYGLKTGSVFSVVKSPALPTPTKERNGKQDPKKKSKGACFSTNWVSNLWDEDNLK